MDTVDSRVDTGIAAVSWAAIGAGALVAAGISLILLVLGSGLGFASLSPWPGRGVAAGTFTVIAAVWLIVTQWVASALGGYIAGRLRVRWPGTHHHEVFFRDTAHGLVTWALATALVTAWTATVVTSADPATDPATSGGPAVDQGYAIDRLFRPAEGTGAAPVGDAAGALDRAQVARLLGKFMLDGSFADSDRQFLAGLVATRTGLPVPVAQKRVDELVAGATAARSRLRATADAARKAAAQAAILLALALLIGAFIASVSAALGGRLRDQHV